MKINDNVRAISDKKELVFWKGKEGKIEKIQVEKATRQKRYWVFFPGLEYLLEKCFKQAWFYENELEVINAVKIN